MNQWKLKLSSCSRQSPGSAGKWRDQVDTKDFDLILIG